MLKSEVAPMLDVTERGLWWDLLHMAAHRYLDEVIDKEPDPDSGVAFTDDPGIRVAAALKVHGTPELDHYDVAPLVFTLGLEFGAIFARGGAAVADIHTAWDMAATNMRSARDSLAAAIAEEEAEATRPAKKTPKKRRGTAS